MIHRLADALNCQPFCAFLILKGKNMIDIFYEQDDVVVKIPKQLIATNKYLYDFIELLRTKQVLEKSEMTEQQIWELSEEVKQQWWDEHKAQFLADIK
jgi:hypothetical protein